MDKKEKIKRKIYNIIGKAVNKVAQSESGQSDFAEKTVTEGMPELLRKAGAEGTVLLRNDADILPLSKNEEIAVFGRLQFDWFYVGYGSGGDVVKPYTVNLAEGLKNDGATLNERVLSFYEKWCKENPVDHGFWGHWPRYYDEAPLPDELIENAAKTSKTAVFTIGRSAGEDRENAYEKGSYLLTDDEEKIISQLLSHFENLVLILNVGSIIDLSWTRDLAGNIAIIMPYQSGMESGNAVADVLLGVSEPSGRLTDTIASYYEYYPSAKDFGNKDFNNYTEDIFVGYRYFETFGENYDVLHPFGYGLSYTKFTRDGKLTAFNNDFVEVTATVKNIGDRSGKEVLQLYCEAPQGKLGKALRVLCDFKKTRSLAPDESEQITLKFPLNHLASYDDSGVTGYKNAYVLEAGEYSFYLGGDVKSAVKIGSFTLKELQVSQTLKQVSAPQYEFDRLVNEKGKKSYRPVPISAENLRDTILKSLPEATPQTSEKITLADVKNGTKTLKEFVATFSLDELEAISHGDYTMNSPLGAKGNAGALGGVTESLRSKGVEPLITTDGPSGIRLKACCSLLPVGTSLASMWNTELTEEIYAKIGGEMKERGSHILLAPGMNIHRNPLCGRNFEYYSEDPLVTGKTAAAVVRGVQSAGVSACPKHFACNSQETNRTNSDSRLSERALREIYLKGFEICVKESKPLCIMTSYNKINGVWGHYNYNLVTRILREEWGFSGLVMTDWWMQKSKSSEFPKMRDNAYRVRAGVDVLMPGGDRAGKRKPDGTLLKTYKKLDGITLGEMQAVAERVVGVNLALASQAKCKE